MIAPHTSALITTMFVFGAVAGHAQTPQESGRGPRFELGTFFGAMVAGKEVARGVNSTGGERLIARLGHGGVFGLRAGVHSAWLGAESSLFISSNRAEVRNEFGVAFPNHAERLLLYSADALVYPFGGAIRNGRVRPYITSGVGGGYLSADLDNINDKEAHNRFVWNAGGGVKAIAGEFCVDVRFTNHRLVRASGGADLRSVTVGVGYRF
jgi:opacity protein-like surface antigen